MGYAPQHEPISLRAGPLTCLVGWRRQGETLKIPVDRLPLHRCRDARVVSKTITTTTVATAAQAGPPARGWAVRGAEPGRDRSHRAHGATALPPPEALDAAPPAQGCAPAHPPARQCQHLVPNAADPVLGLPWLLAFDAAPSVQDVVPRKPDDVSGVRPTGLGPLDRLAEDNAEVRATRAEPTGRGEPQVDLEA